MVVLDKSNDCPYFATVGGLFIVIPVTLSTTFMLYDVDFVMSFSVNSTVNGWFVAGALVFSPVTFTLGSCIDITSGVP